MSWVRLPLPGVDLTAAELPLPEAAARYLTRVRRLDVGADVVVFDGRGAEVDATLARAGDLWVARPAGPPRAGRRGAGLTLCHALARGDRWDDVLRQVTELGVERVVAVACERSVVRLDAEKADRRRERWDRIVAEAARQCGRADAPPVIGPFDVRGALANAAEFGSRLVLHPEGGVSLAEAGLCAPVALFVGPEGGFTPSELAAFAAAEVQRVSLGPLVLRTETAATVGAALVLHRLGVL